MPPSIDMKEIVKELGRLSAIRFGKFALHPNFIAPFQIDLSCLLSETELAKEVVARLFNKCKSLTFDFLCGVPAIGNSLAHFLAAYYSFPLIVKGENRRPHINRSSTTGPLGLTVSPVTGRYKSGQRCLVVQDVQVFGHRTLETIEALEEGGLAVVDVLTLFDLKLGGKEKIKRKGYTPHPLMGIDQIIHILFDAGKMGGDQYKLICDFLENAQ